MSEPLLQLSGVTVKFGGHTAVSSLDLEVEPGSLTALIGPNGAGKTTTFNVITGLQAPTGGKVLFQGRDISKLPTHKRARLGIARTFQRLEVFGSMTAHDNVRTAIEIRRSIHRGEAHDGDASHEANALLERVGLLPSADERADTLPTGLARLLEAARALATGPKLILMDEPASGLDDTETEGFMDLLRSFAADGVSVLLVEHDVPLVMALCSEIFVLDFGALLSRGTPAEIQADQRVLDAYLGSAPT